MHPTHAGMAGGMQVVFAHPAPGNALGVQAQLNQRLHFFLLARAHGRDADFQLGHPGGVQAAGHGQALCQRKHHAGGLFAVAQGGVIDHNLLGWMGHAVS